MPALIESITTQLVDLPTIRPHRLSMTTMACQTMVIVRLRASDGIEGIGEATTIGGLSYSAESPDQPVCGLHRQPPKIPARALRHAPLRWRH